MNALKKIFAGLLMIGACFGVFITAVYLIGMLFGKDAISPIFATTGIVFVLYIIGDAVLSREDVEE